VHALSCTHGPSENPARVLPRRAGCFAEYYALDALAAGCISLLIDCKYNNEGGGCAGHSNVVASGAGVCLQPAVSVDCRENKQQPG